MILPVFHVIANLPADGAFGVEEPHALADHTLLRLDVSVEAAFSIRILSRGCKGAR